MSSDGSRGTSERRVGGIDASSARVDGTGSTRNDTAASGSSTDAAQASGLCPAGYTFQSNLIDTGATRVLRAVATDGATPVIIHSSADNDLALMFDTMRTLAGAGIAPVPCALVRWREKQAVVANDVRGDTASAIAHRFGGRLPLKLLVPVCVELAHTVAKLHSSRVIHKDLKPESVLVDPETHRVTLINFAMSADFRAPSSMGGTFAYLSPEQTGRLDVVPDYRLDLYSMGATMYHLATGRPPHVSKNVSTLMHLKLCEDPIPASQVNPDVPQAISDIIGLLLQRQADERYQSAFGAWHDLKACAAALLSETAFPTTLKTHDPSMRLRPVSTIVGRHTEFSKLTTALQATQAGGAALTIVSGRSGVGKSSLVRHLAAHLPRSALFGSGKCDTGSTSNPGFVFAEALAQVMRAVMALPHRKVELYRERVRKALKDEAAVLCDVFPALRTLIGEQPACGAMPPQESKRRFNRLFLALLRAMSVRRRPLVLLLDDLQWAGPASLRLLKVLMMDVSLSHVMVILSFRDNAVSDDHPLRKALKSFSASKTASAHWKLADVELQPLGVGAVSSLVAFQLWDEYPDGMETLVAEILQRTQGIPFLVLQFMRTLYDERVLRHSDETGHWVLDVDRASTMKHTDNVGLVLHNIKGLSKEALEFLKAASCFGQRFSATDVAGAFPDEPEAVLMRMREAVHGGLLACPAGSVLDVMTRFSFFHDRVREAVETLVSPEAAVTLHLTFGRLSMGTVDGLGESATDVQVFEVVGHYVAARELVTDPAEIHHVACLLLEAAKRSVASTSYSEAVSYAEAALEFIGGTEHCWEWDATPEGGFDLAPFELAFGLESLLASACVLDGQNDKADGYVAEVLAHCRSGLEKSQVLSVQIAVVFANTQLKEAYGIGMQAMQAVGVTFPQPTPEASAANAQETGALLAQFTVDRLKTTPVTTDPNVLQAYRTLGDMIPAAFYLPDEYLTMLLCVGVRLCIEHGPAPQAAVALVFWSLIMQIVGQADLASELGSFAFDLVQDCEDETAKGRTYMAFGGHLNWLRNPLEDDRKYLMQATTFCLRSGENLFAWGAKLHLRLTDLVTGVPVNEWAASAAVDATLTRDRLFYGDGVEAFRALMFFAKRLSVHEAHGVAEYITETEDEFEARMMTRPATILFWYTSWSTMFHYIMGNFEKGIANAEVAIANLYGLRGHFNIPVMYTFHALCQLQLAMRLGDGAEDVAKRAELVALTDEPLSVVKMWAAKSPHNLAPYLALLTAARAAASSTDMREAAVALDAAIDAAETRGISHLAGMACELSARYYATVGCKRMVAMLVQRAYGHYGDFGADRKCRAIVTEFGSATTEMRASRFTGVRDTATTVTPSAGAGPVGLTEFAPRLRTARSVGSSASTVAKVSSPTHDSLTSLATLAVDATVDLESMLNAATALSREHTVRGVIGVLIKAVMANMAAQCAVFLVRSSDEPSAPAGSTRNLAESRPASARPPPSTGAGAGAGAGSARSSSGEGESAAAFTAADHESVASASSRRRRFAKSDSGGSSLSVATPSSGYHSMQPVVQAMCVGAEDPKFFDEQAGLSSFVSTFACDVVRACFNSRQVILLHDASTDATFQSDPYVTTTKLKSVLCVPVFNKDVFAGVLYLHNKSFKGAFLPRRMPLLNILTTQMAISLENAEALTQLTANNKELERLGSVKDRFLATTSHELRTPLNGILGTASLLVDTTLNMEQREYVDTIVSSGELLRSLLTDLIDLSKLQSGRMRLLNRDLELGALLEHCVSVLAPLANQKGVRLALVDNTLATATPLSCYGDGAPSDLSEGGAATSELQQWIVRADQSRLQQIVLNLVNNAIKFTSSGSITVGARVDVDAADAPPGCCFFVITVADTGIGIKEEDQHHIFDMFSQVDMRDQRTYGGSGIGLAICRLLMESMGGSIRVDSDGATGSCFTVRVPLPFVQRRKLPTTCALAPGARVLLVDTRADVNDCVCRVLADAGAAVHGLVTEPNTAMANLAPLLASKGETPEDPPFLAVIINAALLSMELLDACQEAGIGVFCHGHKFVWNDAERSHPSLTRLAASASPASLVLAMFQLNHTPQEVSELEQKVQVRSHAHVGSNDCSTQLVKPSTPRSKDVARLPVLVVDDQKVNLKMMERMLHRHGYEVVTAMDGKEALDVARRSSFSVILMDVMMPVMNGLEATRQLRLTDRVTPVVAVTASVAAEDVAECQRAGMTSFLPKPVTKDQVVAMVSQFAVPTKEVKKKSSRVRNRQAALENRASNGASSG